MINNPDPKAIRRQLYGLLYHKPLFNYAKELPDKPDKKAIRILIAGDDPVREDVFKAVFWCGQMPESYDTLSVTIASSDPLAAKARFAQDMPALCSGLVPVAVEYVDYSSTSSFSDFGVIFITDRTGISADIIFDSLMSRLEQEAAVPSRMLVCLCQDHEIPAREIRLRNGLQIDVCSLFTPWDMSELERYALNIDFAYNLGQDERAKRPSMADFIGEDNQYNHDSSFAGAVHIPYKLRICEEYAECNKPEAFSVLLQTIAEHAAGDDNALYNTLLELEHRRWSAYMIVEGWQMPTDEELGRYAYSKGNDHRNKAPELKRHPCLCLGSKNGSLLRLHYDLWNDEKIRNIFSLQEMIDYLHENPKHLLLTELDAVSLVLHNIASKRAEEVIKKYGDLFSFIGQLDPDTDRRVYQNLYSSAKKLRNDEPNSIKLYHDALKEAKNQAAEDHLDEKIESIENGLDIIVTRNRKTDFFDIDSALIDMLPFCIWYGRKYKTVVTFSNSVPVEDVIVPTILSADKAVFICRNGATESYKKAVRDYFTNSRGGYTQVLFDRIDSSDIDDIVKKIDTVIEENAGAVINWTASDDAATAMAIGIAYNRPYMPVFKYVPGTGIINIKDGSLISAGLGRKSLSIDEYVSLMGGEYRNVYKNVGNIHDFEHFKKVFFEYLKEREYKISENKREFKSIWNAMSNIFQSSAKDDSQNWKDEAEFSSPHTYEGDFNTLLFESCGLRAFLSSLSIYRIIIDYACEEKDGTTTVRFKYIDKELPNLLETYKCGSVVDSAKLVECSHKQLKFIPKKGIVVSSTRADNIPYAGDNENEQFINDKADFLALLEELGLIKNLVVDNNSHKASFEFKNIKTMQLFKTQGKIFELVMYAQFKNSGLFDDVQTSVQVCWDLNTEKEEAIVLKRIQKSAGFGYHNYHEIRQAVRNDIISGKLDSGTENEIDIILACGMTPVFVSCKTGNKGENDWLNEIATLASHFHARPLLAVTKNLDLPKARPLLARARKTRVSVIGSETFMNEETMTKAMQELRSGKMVIGKKAYVI